MSPDQTAPPSAPLQFDAADVTTDAPGVTCAACSKAVTSAYYQVNDAITCPSCRATLEEQVNGTGTRAGRMLRATLFGAIGGAIGAGIYYAILAKTGYEIGFIAILVGWLVGSGVRRGSGGRGGWRYQAIAMAMTWFAIGAVYAPLIMREFNESQVAAVAGDSTQATDSTTAATPTLASAAAPDSATVAAPVIDASARTAAAGDSSAAGAVSPPERSLGGFLLAIGVRILFVLASPVLVAIANVVSLFFVGIAMWEAWRQNKRLTLTITGPFRVGADDAGAAAAPAGA